MRALTDGLCGERQPGPRSRGESFGQAAFLPGFCHGPGILQRSWGPPRPCAPDLGNARARSGTLGRDRSRSGPLGPARTLPAPLTWLSSGPLCSAVPSPTWGRSPRTAELSGGGGALGAQKLSRSPAPGLPAPPRTSRVLGLKGARAHPITSCLGLSGPQGLSRRTSHSCLLSALQSSALQPQFPLLAQRGVVN